MYNNNCDDDFFVQDELVAGLHLNMSAKEMRERVGSVKKTDPRVEHIDLKEKHKIINSL